MVAMQTLGNGYQRMNAPKPKSNSNSDQDSDQNPDQGKPFRKYGINADVGRLVDAIHTSMRILKRYRIERREMVRQLVGSHYSEDGAFKSVPLNMLSMYVEIVSRSLIAKEPRVMLGTFDRQAKPMVRVLQDWMNDRLPQMGVAETLQRWVMDAMISVGILKCALAGPGESALAAYGVEPGMPFLDNVSLDDFAFDHGATRLKFAGFFAHRVRLPLDAANRQYARKGKKLQASGATSYNPGHGDERASNIGRGSRAIAQEFEDMTTVWEVFLARERKVVILAGDGSGAPTGDVLEIKPWIGPPCGPFLFLGYQMIPDNPMPKGPLLDLADLHLTLNRIMRKLFDQAERQKTNLLVPGTQMDNASRYIDLPDGEAIRYDGSQPPQVVRWGGPEPGNVQFAELMRTLFSWRGGNLDIMGGLSHQSKTASQDQLLNQNAGMSVADKADSTLRGVSEGMGALAWFYYHHPRLVMQTEWSPQGAPEYTLERNLYPYNPTDPSHFGLMANQQQMRSIPWEQVRLKVDPYSMRHQTPQQRAADLIGLMKEIIIPMMPLLAQQGKVPNMDAFLSKIGEYRDMVDLTEIIDVTEPIQTAGSGGGGTMPGSTSREYVRRSMGGDQSSGSAMNDIQNYFAGAAAASVKSGGQPAPA